MSSHINRQKLIAGELAWQSWALALNSPMRLGGGSELKQASSLVNRSIKFLCLAASCTCMQASITFNIDAGHLKTRDGSQLMSVNGLVLLVGSTKDSSFGRPTPESFVTGDDIILYRGDLNSGFGPGLFQRAVSFSLSSLPGLKPGDPVQLYWFPTRTAGDANPGEGTTYGSYRHDTGLDGSAPWVIPSDGSLVNLKFITASLGGANSNTIGYASHVITQPLILSLTVASSTNVVITWSAVSNLTYRVRHRPELNSPWINLVPDVTATNTTASAVDNPGGAGQRFYQVMLVP